MWGKLRKAYKNGRLMRRKRFLIKRNSNMCCSFGDSREAAKTKQKKRGGKREI